MTTQEVRDRIARHVMSRRRIRRFYRESPFWRAAPREEQARVLEMVNGSICAILELAREEFPR